MAKRIISLLVAILIFMLMIVVGPGSNPKYFGFVLSGLATIWAIGVNIVYEKLLFEIINADKFMAIMSLTYGIPYIILFNKAEPFNVGLFFGLLIPYNISLFYLLVNKKD